MWALLPDEAFPEVYAALAGSQLYVASRARLPAAPEDAPSLCNRVEITIADRLRTPGDTGARERAVAALAAADLRARVGSVDVR